MIDVSCDNCKKGFMVYPTRYSERIHLFCSRKCESEYRIKNNPNYIPCEVCGKIFYKKPQKIKDHKNHCCSRQCLGELKKTIYSGENNPNFGNTGNKNPLYNSNDRMFKNGYIWIRLPEHPCAPEDGWIREHRIIAETFLELNDENSFILNGKRYLNKNYDVHHKDMQKHNNLPENLEILTRSEHQKLHMSLRKNLRN